LTQVILHLSTTPKNVTALPCEMQNTFSGSKFYCSSQKCDGFEIKVGCLIHKLEFSDEKYHKNCQKLLASVMTQSSGLFWYWSVT